MRVGSLVVEGTGLLILRGAIPVVSSNLTPPSIFEEVIMYVYVVEKNVQYEGNDLQGIFSNRDSALIEAKRLAEERMKDYDYNRGPVYEYKDAENGQRYEWFYIDDVEFWFYKVEVKD